MRMNDLQDGQIVKARWGRAGREAPEFGPWQDISLSVHKRCGRTVILTIRGVEWAEYVPDDFDGGVFVCEDYYLEIKGLSKELKEER